MVLIIISNGQSLIAAYQALIAAYQAPHTKAITIIDIKTGILPPHINEPTVTTRACAVKKHAIATTNINPKTVSIILTPYSFLWVMISNYV